LPAVLVLYSRAGWKTDNPNNVAAVNVMRLKTLRLMDVKDRRHGFAGCALTDSLSERPRRTH